MSARPEAAERGGVAPDAATRARPLVRELHPVPRTAGGPSVDAGPGAGADPEPPVAAPALAASHRPIDLLALLEDLRPALEQPRMDAAALTVTSAIAWRLGFDRVSLGLVRGGRVSLAAISDAPERASRSALARALEAAMEEAATQDGVVLHEAGAPGALHAHRQLVAEGGARKVYSVPLHRVPVGRDGAVRAVLLCEDFGEAPVDPSCLRACEALAGVLGPALELKRRDAAVGVLRRLCGRGRVLALLAALLAVAAFSAVHTDYRVSAPARVEGSVQRVVVAPFDGYVETAPARAGDRVAAGQVLATLQESSLVLERDNHAAERDELAKQYRRALAERDRAEARVLEARMAQADARVDLLDARIARARITAPVSGVVLSGDLGRSLGAPVERGQVLFEVAPLDGHRIVLQADERDVADLVPGQTGVLALASLPDAEFPLTLERVSGAARTEAGRAVFLVEARLDGDAPMLRPGMEGVAKVSVDRRALVWIVTHRLVEWLGLAVWSVLP